MGMIGKYVIVAVFVAAAVFFWSAAVRAAGVNIQRLRSWKRIPATVYVASDPVSVQVKTGSGADERTLSIPRTYDAGYEPNSSVTVLENPDNPVQRRLTGVIDLWNDTAVWVTFALALSLAAWLVWSTHWGSDAVWSGGGWNGSLPMLDSSADFEVTEPRQSWISNVFFGLVLGLALGLPPFFADGGWTPWRALWAIIGIAAFLWMAQNAALNYTRTVRVSSAGIEERSVFGRRLVPWREIGNLHFQNVAEELDKLKPWKDRRRIGLPHIDVWAVQDKEERVAFTLPAEMQPAPVFRAMRDEIQRRVTAQKIAAGQ